MGAAAELHRHTGNINDAHHIGVLLPKHRHSAGRFGLINRHLLHVKPVGFGNPSVDQCFDLHQLLRRHRVRGVEVEAQSIEIHQGTGLADPRIHHLLERSLEKVGGGVIRLSPAPAGAIHLSCHGLTQGELTAFHTTGMHEHITATAHGINPHDEVRAGQQPAIAHLATAFSVEGCGVEHHLNRITSLRVGGRFAVHHKRLDAGGVVESHIPLEAGRRLIGHHLIDRILKREINAHRSGLGPLTLLLHRRLEAIEIDG